MNVTLVLLAAACALGAADYDLLLQGGHLIDGKNRISAIRDVAISAGKIAAVAEKIDPSKALKTVNVAGLYVTPGLIDIHAHVYTHTGEKSSYAGDNSIAPDGFTFRIGVTTVADAGGAGWRNFPDFRQRIIDRSKTRVLAFINIVGHGMRGNNFEHNLDDMDAGKTAEMAMAQKDVIVGIKTAHYRGPEWTPVERAVQAGKSAGIPVMVDFGINHPDSRPLADLLTKKLRPGDIYTHLYSGHRNEMTEDGKPSPGLVEGRRRGVIFDVGHGGGSFTWRVAAPLVRAGFTPDSISTDLHVGSMNSGMKDLLNVMSKFLALGMPVDDVILRSTWNPAREIQRTDLGHLSVGAVADVAVLRVEKGSFGFVDMYGSRLRGGEKFTCELTVRDGKVVYDLNGITREDWDKLTSGFGPQGDSRWDATIGHAPVNYQAPSSRSRLPDQPAIELKVGKRKRMAR
ncbi:MAG: amidohydrolase/deacetylase family metallohydrolase [Bryobacteraceae bacterium]